MIASAIHHFDSFFCSQSQQGSSSTSNPTYSIWTPPSTRGFKVNFDAAVNTTKLMGSVAAIVRDEQGQVTGWRCKLFPNIEDPLVLESLACREDIQLAIAKGLANAIIEGEVVINSCKGYVSSVEIQGLISDVILLAESLTSVTFSYVR
ncbi:hypothetical protein P3X46_017157 [Hevea brasiliensis]|uniref:RNase H type-1 domain-containing protein n=1 Tax=Hevea brasiliensis TaxID=3981 RepID=A0ABQ9M1D3_HEVBR|nr:hypothetical protein P3X46_017157 [Hevea brasiliensis]